MDSDRCPSCAAAVRKGADWCTLCYADLRPAPPPVQRAPYPQPSSPQVYAAAPATTPATDALHAPYEHVLAAVYGGAASMSVTAPAADGSAPPAKAVGWPCTQCGEINDFDKVACVACTAPFGAQLRTGAPTVERKKMMMYAVGTAVAFLLLVAALTFVTTKPPRPDPGTTDRVAPTQSTATQPDEVQPGAPLQPGEVLPTQPGQQVAPAAPGVATGSGPLTQPGLIQPATPAATVPAQ